MKLTIFPKLSSQILQKLKPSILLLVLVLVIYVATAQKPVSQQDITIPNSTKSDALCNQLHTVTICTSNIDSIRLFYVKGMGMELKGPIKQTANQKKSLRRLWSISPKADWELYILHRPTVPENIQLRVLHIKSITPLIHTTYNAREMGPFTLGFPNANQENLDSELKTLGFTTMAPMQAAMLNKPDGSKYKYLETIYKAPDFIHAVGIERGNGMAQLAPYDSSTLKGGPGYSAQIVTGLSNEVIQFYTDVLGWEIRRDNEWSTSAGSALGIEADVPFRFTILYAKGATSGHMILMDFKDNQKISSNAAPRIPNRGIGMYSFFTKNILQVKSNAIKSNIKIIQDIISINYPGLGQVKVITLLSPNNVLIEILQH